MKRLTDEARAEIARGWLNSSLKLADYAAGVGVAPRTVRSYVAHLAGRHGERQALAQEVDADIKKLTGDVNRLHQRIDLLQQKVDALHRLLVVSGPDAAGRQEPSVPARQDAVGADPSGPAGTSDRHDALGEPESRPDVEC